MLTVVWDSDGGDDDDDDGGDGDSGDTKVENFDCKINDPTTTDALYKATLDRIDLDTTKYPKALCNDGSAGAYYFKRSET
eukprot:8244950-Pyramimonas_sp.AAC.1